jgi:hypothetical protein
MSSDELHSLMSQLQVQAHPDEECLDVVLGMPFKPKGSPYWLESTTDQRCAPPPDRLPYAPKYDPNVLPRYETDPKYKTFNTPRNAYGELDLSHSDLENTQNMLVWEMGLRQRQARASIKRDKKMKDAANRSNPANWTNPAPMNWNQGFCQQGGPQYCVPSRYIPPKKKNRGGRGGGVHALERSYHRGDGPQWTSGEDGIVRVHHAPPAAYADPDLAFDRSAAVAAAGAGSRILPFARGGGGGAARLAFARPGLQRYPQAAGAANGQPQSSF